MSQWGCVEWPQRERKKDVVDVLFYILFPAGREEWMASEMASLRSCIHLLIMSLLFITIATLSCLSDRTISNVNFAGFSARATGGGG